jgi:phospholipid N-methyltransferase
LKKIKSMEKNWKIKGSIKPSSKYLVNAMISKIDFDKDIHILQLGFGTGVFTKKILENLNDGSKITVFEIDRKCDKHLKNFNDKRLQYIKDSAENISAHFKDNAFDYILSTLPFATLPSEMLGKILSQIKVHLKQGGTFLQYQYSLITKKKIENLFDKAPLISFVARNLPPAFVYEVQTGK